MRILPRQVFPFVAMMLVGVSHAVAQSDSNSVVTLESELERTPNRDVVIPEEPFSANSGVVNPEAPTPDPTAAEQEPPALEPLIEEESDEELIGPSYDSAFPDADSIEADRAAEEEISETFEAFGSDFGDSAIGNFFGSLGEFFRPGAGSNAEPDPRDNLRLSLAGTVGYDDNIFYTNTDQMGSGTYGFDGSMRYELGNERLEIAGELAGGVTYYDNRQGDPSDQVGEINLNLNYDATRRLKITGFFRGTYQSQPDPVLQGALTRFNGDYYYVDSQFELRYIIRPRWTAYARYQFSGFFYVDELAQTQNFYQQFFTLGLEQRFSERTAVSVEYRYNPVDYYNQDFRTQGHIVTAGFNHLLTPRLTWSLQAGGEYRLLESTQVVTLPPPLPDPLNPFAPLPPPETATVRSTDEYFGPFLETNVSQFFARDSSLVLGVRYGTEPTGGGSNLVVNRTFRVNLAVNHAFTTRLSGYAGVIYQNQYYDQPDDISDFEQDIYTGYLGLRFQLNAALAVTGDYYYTAVETDNEASNYTRSVTTLGLEIVF